MIVIVVVVLVVIVLQNNRSTPDTQTSPVPDQPKENCRMDNPPQAHHTTPLDVVVVDVGVEERTEVLQKLKR